MHTPPDAPQPCERRYREEHAKLVVAWLRHHYELADSRFTILKSTVFHDYLVMCRHAGVESTTAAVFGRFVKRAFPSIRCSRKGLDGRSLHCYRCLKRKGDTSSGASESSPRVPAPVEGGPAPHQEASGSDSGDEGCYVDDELRHTIEELCQAGSMVELSLSQPTTDDPSSSSSSFVNEAKSDADERTSKPEWQEPCSPIERCLSLASIPRFPALDRAPPPPPAAMSRSISQDDAPYQQHNSTVARLSYHPSHGREYLSPDTYPPTTLRCPSTRTYQTAPFCASLDYDPSDSGYCAATTSAHHTTHTATVTYSSALSPYLQPGYDCQPSALPDHQDRWPMYENQHHHPSPQQPTAVDHTFPAGAWSTAEEQQQQQHHHPAAVPYASDLDEPWTTANPTPYPSAYETHEQTPAQFRPRLVTQSCPVHAQPATFHPFYCRPLQMRTT